MKTWNSFLSVILFLRSEEMWNSFLSVVLFWRIFRSSISMCLWCLSTLSVSFQPLWSSATSAQEVAPYCTWTGDNKCEQVCVCVWLTASISGTSSSSSLLLQSNSELLWFHHWGQNFLSVSGYILEDRVDMKQFPVFLPLCPSVSSWQTSLSEWSMSQQWFGRSKVKPRVRVVLFVRPADLEPSFSLTCKMSWQPAGADNVHEIPLITVTLLPQRWKCHHFYKSCWSTGALKFTFKNVQIIGLHQELSQ